MERRYLINNGGLVIVDRERFYSSGTEDSFLLSSKESDDLGSNGTPDIQPATFDLSFPVNNDDEDDNGLGEKDEAPLLKSGRVSASNCSCKPKSKRKSHSKRKLGPVKARDSRESPKDIQHRYHALYNRRRNPIILEQQRVAFAQKPATASLTSGSTYEGASENKSTNSHQTSGGSPNNSSHSARGSDPNGSSNCGRISDLHPFLHGMDLDAADESVTGSTPLKQVSSTEPLLETKEIDSNFCVCVPRKSRLRSPFQPLNESGAQRSNRRKSERPLPFPYFTLENPKPTSYDIGPHLKLRHTEIRNSELQEEARPFYVGAPIVTNVTSERVQSPTKSKPRDGPSGAWDDIKDYPQFRVDLDELEDDRDDSDCSDELQNPPKEDTLSPPLDNPFLDNQLSTLYEEDEDQISHSGSSSPDQSKTEVSNADLSKTDKSNASSRAQSITDKLKEYLKRDGEANFDLATLSLQSSLDASVDDNFLFDSARATPPPHFRQTSLLLQAAQSSNITLYSQKSGLYGLNICDERDPDEEGRNTSSHHRSHSDYREGIEPRHPENRQPENRTGANQDREEPQHSQRAEQQSGIELRQDAEHERGSLLCKPGRLLKKCQRPAEDDARGTNGYDQIIFPTSSEEISELTEDFHPVVGYPTARCQYERRSPSGRRSPKWVCKSRPSDPRYLMTEDSSSSGRQSPYWISCFSKKRSSSSTKEDSERSSRTQRSSTTPDSSQEKRTWQYQELTEEEYSAGRRWSSHSRSFSLESRQQPYIEKSGQKHSASTDKKSLAQMDTLTKYNCLTLHRLEI